MDDPKQENPKNNWIYFNFSLVIMTLCVTVTTSAAHNYDFCPHHSSSILRASCGRRKTPQICHLVVVNRNNNNNTVTTLEKHSDSIKG